MLDEAQAYIKSQSAGRPSVSSNSAPNGSMLAEAQEYAKNPIPNQIKPPVPQPGTLQKAANLSDKFLSGAGTALGYVANKVGQGVAGAIGTFPNMVASGGKKGLVESFKTAPDFIKQVVTEPFNVAEEQNPKLGQNTAFQFGREFTKGLTDLGLQTAGSLAIEPIASRIATSKTSIKVTPEQVGDIITGRAPQGTPLSPEAEALVKKELLNPDTQKAIVKEATQKGVEFKKTAPASPIRQIAGQYLGGAAEQPTTETLVGGKKIGVPSPVATKALPGGTMAEQLDGLVKGQQAPTMADQLKTIVEGPKQPTMAEQLDQVVRQPQVSESVSTQSKPLEPIGTGETKTSKLALGVEQKAVEQKLINNLGGLPEYQQVSMKEQAQHATNLLAQEPERALSIALGKETPPAHILPESVFTAVEENALKNGDVETIRQLASSNLATEATAMGQRIRALGERNPNSPVETIKNIVRERTKAVGNKTKATVQEIRQKIVKPKKEDWNSFVDSIICT